MLVTLLTLGIPRLMLRNTKIVSQDWDGPIGPIWIVAQSRLQLCSLQSFYQRHLILIFTNLIQPWAQLISFTQHEVRKLSGQLQSTQMSSWWMWTTLLKHCWCRTKTMAYRTPSTRNESYGHLIDNHPLQLRSMLATFQSRLCSRWHSYKQMILPIVVYISALMTLITKIWLTKSLRTSKMLWGTLPLWPTCNRSRQNKLKWS